MSAIYTMEDVATHKSKGDTWMVINGGVYDVTEFMDIHPGGAGMLKMVAGKDAVRSRALDLRPIPARPQPNQRGATYGLLPPQYVTTIRHPSFDRLIGILTRGRADDALR
jgi:hypothetical protein